MPTGWALAAAINQGLLTGAAFLAMGSALFALWVRTPPAAQGLIRVVGRRASALAVVFYLAALGLVGASLMDAGLFDPRSWEFGLHTTLSDSAAFGVPAMLILLFSFIRPDLITSRRRQRLIVLIGVTLGVASFLVTGHAVVATPRWMSAPAYTLHILGAAFWLGALAPLARTLKVLQPEEAWRVIAQFSTVAVYAVAAIVASGLVLTGVHAGSLNALVSSEYGQRLSVKVTLAALLIAVAGYNKIVLTPALKKGDATASRRLRLSIVSELVLLVVILAAAVALSMAPPPEL